MNILFTRFPLASTPYGGAENQTVALMEGLRARGHEIGFIGSCPALLKRTEELRIKNYELRIGPPPVTKWGVVSFLWRRKKMQGMLIEAIEKLEASGSKPQAIFMLSLSEKLLLTDWATESGIKVFWIEHDRIGSWLKWNPWLSLLRRVSKKATIVCVSELSKKLYGELGFDPGGIIVIPNGVPPPSPSPFPRGGKGEETEVEKTPKKPVNTTILKFARTMRKSPTEAEELLWKYLRFDQLGVRFRRQHPFNSRILDFYCHEKRLGIEIDGLIHTGLEHRQYDREREEVFAEFGIRIARFSNDEVLNEVEHVVDCIKKIVRSPPPSGEGLGVGENWERGQE